VLAHEPAERHRVVGHVEAEEGQVAAARDAAVVLGQVAQLLDARGAPGGPEIDDNHLPPKLVGAKRRPFQRADLERR